ncbi:MAG: sugar ABC transporter permease [Polyangiaceae bacterium]|nr:sugar ABC transporter permease [Polyangiaceae bacterium]
MRPRAWWHPWLMLGPTAAVLLTFFVAPVGAALYQSLFSWDLLTPPRLVGLANYEVLARSGELLAVTLTTLRYSAMVVVGAVGLGLGLALLLARPGRFFAAARAAIFSAYVVSWVSVALLWMWLLDPDSGLVAGLLRWLGAPRMGFLTDPDSALATLAAVTVWKITGYAMILFVVGLQDIPPALREAAALDGAGPLARFWYLTLPMLRPTLAFVATTSLIISFQAFDVVRVMTQGGPVKATTLFVYAIYEQVFLDLRVGRASALTVIFLLVLVLLSALQLWAFRGHGGRR